jgi:hypothetical protein
MQDDHIGGGGQLGLLLQNGVRDCVRGSSLCCIGTAVACNFGALASNPAGIFSICNAFFYRGAVITHGSYHQGATTAGVVGVPTGVRHDMPQPVRARPCRAVAGGGKLYVPGWLHVVV